MQKFDAASNSLWSVRLGIDQVGGKPSSDDTFVVGDEAGVAIVSWRDFRNSGHDHASIYAQRIDTDGKLKWETGGVEVSITSPNPRSSMVSDAQGGAVIAYGFQENGGDQQGLHLQKVDADGNTVWQENGIVITERIYAGQDIASDGQGGIIVGWGVGVSMFGSEKAYVQRIDPSGKSAWGGNGITLNP